MAREKQIYVSAKALIFMPYTLAIPLSSVIMLSPEHSK
jgi:hypothetical protein